ncbi:MAG: DUF6261 family protein [Dysgonamonadaceae bacterium]|jgi:hypothetical protein|nr:DUF6261 family protein [Dysgonamonadaceae bacterium]
MKIRKIRAEHFRNETHFQYISLAQKLISSNPAIVNIVADRMGEFNTEVELESKLVDTVRSSPYTEKLEELDKRLDRAIVGLNATIEADLHHYNPQIVEAAKRLSLRMKSFRGEIENKPYEDESAAVKVLLNDLQSTYSEDVGTLSLSGWVFEISDAQTKFEETFILRNKEWASRPQESLRDVRKRVDTIYRNMVELIDAYGALNGYSVTGEFVAELNREVTYFNSHNHRVKHDIAHCEPEEIPNQAYNGYPITPTPLVLYPTSKKTLRLELGKDYNLSFKDNVEVGNAQCTIHGIGAYKGSKTVTFIIKRIV